MSEDNWKHRSEGMKCLTCMWFVYKHPVVQINSDDEKLLSPTELNVGRCRRHAPTMNGYPVVFVSDWCGDHKLDETKI